MKFIEKTRHKKPQTEKAPLSYGALANAMSNKGFAVLKYGRQPYAAIKQGPRIVTSPLLVDGVKNPGCWAYDEKGPKMASHDDVYIPYDHIGKEKAALCGIEELLRNRPVLEETKAFPNFIAALENALEILKAKNLHEQETIEFVYDNLSYLLTPRGQKDKLFEQSTKEAGLAGATTVDNFLKEIDMQISNRHMKRKTPYGQVGLPKSAYYELNKLHESGETTDLEAMIWGITTEDDSYLHFTRSKSSFKRAKAKFLACLPDGFIRRAAHMFPVDYSRGVRPYDNGGACNRKFWEALVKLGGCSMTDPLPAKIKAVEKMVAKAEADDRLRYALRYYDIPNYFLMANGPLNWPQKCEEFCQSYVMDFLDRIPDHQDMVDYAKSKVQKNGSPIQNYILLCEIQEQFRLEEEEEWDRERQAKLKEEYSRSREKLKEALGSL